VESGREVYALDPRGFGDSERPAEGYDVATSAKDIHDFIEAVGPKRAGGVDIIAHEKTWTEDLLDAVCVVARRPERPLRSLSPVKGIPQTASRFSAFVRVHLLWQ